MATVAKLGPADHGQAMTIDEYFAGNYQEGHKYELIGGKLHVSPAPNLHHAWTALWVNKKLDTYADAHPEIINFVASGSRVCLPGARRATVLQPDLAVYCDPRLDWPDPFLHWRNVSPILIVQVRSGSDPDWVVRTGRPFSCLPSLKEHWIVDILEDYLHPEMIVSHHEQWGWRYPASVYEFGTVYTTRLLPGFALHIDPCARR